MNDTDLLALVRLVEGLIDKAVQREGIRPSSWRIVATTYEQGKRPKQRRFTLRELIGPPKPRAVPRTRRYFVAEQYDAEQKGMGSGR